MYNNLAVKGAVMNSLRGRVIKLYKEKGRTMKDVAEAVGVKLPTMSKYLSKGIPIKYETLEKMAEYLEVDVSYLTGETNIRRQYNKPSEFAVEFVENLKKDGFTDQDIKEIGEFAVKLRQKKEPS